jgi:hypothetical protein
MKTIAWSLIIISQLVIFNFFSLPSAKLNSVDEKKSILKEGRWINNGVRNIVGQGIDKIIEIKKNEEGFVLLITEIKYYSINDKNHKVPEKQIKGPYKVTVIGELLRLEYEGEIDNKTFRFEDQTLVWPALINIENNIWYYKSNEYEYKFICENSPEIITKGKAIFQSTSSSGTGWEQYYALVKLRNTDNEEKRELKFFEMNRDGKVNEWAKLVWDNYGSPRFEGTSWYFLDEVRYINYTTLDN